MFDVIHRAKWAEVIGGAKRTQNLSIEKSWPVFFLRSFATTTKKADGEGKKRSEIEDCSVPSECGQ